MIAEYCLVNLLTKVLCTQAYRQGYSYPRYLFFTISWYAEEWWTKGVEEYGCTAEEMERVLKYSMTLLILPYARYVDNSTQTDTGGGLVSEHLAILCL